MAPLVTYTGARNCSFLQPLSCDLIYVKPCLQPCSCSDRNGKAESHVHSKVQTIHDADTEVLAMSIPSLGQQRSASGGSSLRHQLLRGQNRFHTGLHIVRGLVSCFCLEVNSYMLQAHRLFCLVPASPEIIKVNPCQPDDFGH